MKFDLKKVLQFLQRRGIMECPHPVMYVTVMHWNPTSECGHICEVCMGYVKIPRCSKCKIVCPVCAHEGEP